jgi:hypothetical protein
MLRRTMAARLAESAGTVISKDAWMRGIGLGKLVGAADNRGVR